MAGNEHFIIKLLIEETSVIRAIEDNHLIVSDKF
jgi:hypothetical protein